MRRHGAKTGVKGGLTMANLQNGERTRVMIVEQDLDFGLKLADWLATQGYQPVFVRSVDAAIDELNGIRPQAIFFGLGCSDPASRIDIAEVLLMIQTICPRVRTITISGQNNEDLTQVVLRQGARRFVVKSVEFSQVIEVLLSEVSAATV